MTEEIKPAATLILLRDRTEGRPDILMLERGAQLSFVGGAMVFPGGRVDDEDALIAADANVLTTGPTLDPVDATARVAAIRETIEEVGLAPAVEGISDPAMIASIRNRLAERGSFHMMLREYGLRLDLHQLHPFARWLPSLRISRVFDTRFYVAKAPDHDDASVDGSESSHCSWNTAAGHIAMDESGARTIIFPTMCNLQRVGQAESFDDAVAFASRYPIETVSPHLEEREGILWLCIPEHLGYPVTSAPMPHLVQTGRTIIQVDGTSKAEIKVLPG